jgi:Host cell surface-exposed lipoprotein
VDTVSPDWNEQAAMSAESCLESGSFSRSGLIEQLEFEGFTPAQAEYGVQQAY